MTKTILTVFSETRCIIMTYGKYMDVDIPGGERTARKYYAGEIIHCTHMPQAART